MGSSRRPLVLVVALAAQCSTPLGSSLWSAHTWSPVARAPPQLLDGPMIVSIGPVVDPGDVMMVPMGFTGFPIEEFVGRSPIDLGSQGTLLDLDQLLGGIGSFDDVVNADKFRVKTQDGHFTLHATLPGFSIQPADAEAAQADNPLSVEVVGRSLVVRGQKSDAQTMTSFQRCFQLPRFADAEHISVTYNKNDGILAVDVPANSDMPEHVDDENSEWMLNTQEEGSHTSITISSGGGRRAPTALRGGRVAGMGGLMGLMRSTSQSSEHSGDPFLQFLAGLMDASPPDSDRSAGTRVQPQLIEAWPADESSAGDGDVLPSLGDIFGEPPPESPPAPVAPVAPTSGPAYLAQPKNSWPFWRLGADGSVVEIVAPAGTDLGTPIGSRVPIHTTKSIGAHGERVVAGHVDLPVSVLDKNCSWAAQQSSQERVLQCQIKSDAVKRVQIKEAQEL